MTNEQYNAARMAKLARNHSDRAFNLARGVFRSDFYFFHPLQREYELRACKVGARLYTHYFDMWHKARALFGSIEETDNAIESIP